MIHNRVLFVLVLAALVAALMLSFLGFAPNRLVSGRAIPISEAMGPASLGFIILCGAALAFAAFLPQSRALHLAVLAAALALSVILPLTAGAAATRLVATATPIARASLASGFWIMELSSVLAAGDALRRLDAGLAGKAAAVIAVVAVLVIAGVYGAFDQLSLAKEAANRREAFADAVQRHGFLVALSVLLALVIGLPLGVLAQRRPRWHDLIFGGLDIVQTIPSIALFGLLIGPLAALSDAFPELRRIGISGIGVAPAIIALVLYSLLPMARGAFAGLASVPASVVETARGMGMTGEQILLQVEAPIALPVLLSGLRIVTVQAIGLAVVAALIGAGGLGSFVFLGLGQRALDLMLLGAVPTIFMALGVDFIFQLLLGMARRTP
ncbi:MAG: ABC transporter permease [Hyphomicrobiales bacterium]|nr:ABC transporter permease [Hyphomicrobiales bacterium]